MADLPFLHPALLGIAIATGIVWSAVVPDRLRSLAWTVGAGVLAAVVAGVAGWVPWIGALRLTAYGACLLVAFIASWLVARWRSRALGIDPYLVRVQLALAVIAGILGARIWYVIEYHHTFPDPTTQPAVWLSMAADLDRGGEVWFVGLLFASVAMIIHARRAGLPLIPWADCAAPAVLLGLGIGRLGCWFNGCCYGAACELPWAVERHGVHVHPTQLYETVACTILALLVSRVAPGSGRAAGWALIGYAAWRFFNETLRGDYAANLGQGFSLSPFHLTSAQWTGLPLAALGAWLLLRARRSPAPA
jgi:phosphatidylglycerol:prolipoprotein diacylglycerol transferase